MILVDNKFEIDFDNLMAQIRKLSNQPVRYVINTHYHGDHSGGNPKMQAQSVQVVAMGNMFTVGDGLPPLVDYPGGGSTRQWPRSLDA